MSDHTVVQIRAIFRPRWAQKTDVQDANFPYLVYCQRLDIVPQVSSPGASPQKIPDPLTGMYVVRRATRQNGTRIGDIMPMNRLLMPLDLVPRLGAVADPRLSCMNSFEYSSNFSLNIFFDKESYYCLT